MLLDSLLQVPADQILRGVVAQLAAEPGQDDAERHLAGTEPGDAGARGIPARQLLDLFLHDLRRNLDYEVPPAACDLNDLDAQLRLTSVFRLFGRNWCERGELNPHPLRDWILSPARLPVPPLSHTEGRSNPILQKPTVLQLKRAM